MSASHDMVTAAKRAAASPTKKRIPMEKKNTFVAWNNAIAIPGMMEKQNRNTTKP
ncbi:MAG: hypothetical protein PVH61_25840 [Candidatus Aminicenantes bacterium]